MTKSRFRPCIDLHQGKVKQIVGGTLRDDGPGPKENFVSELGAGDFAKKFRDDRLTGGHVIKLGPGNDEAAREALAAWPGGMQIGGGIHVDNAQEWLDAGASHVIVTSWLFDDGVRLSDDKVRLLAERIGPERLVIDLSCRRDGDGWTVATNRWQTLTDLKVDECSLDRLAPFCDEFLIHAADVEGLCGGIDHQLVELLGSWGGKPVTYAGGASSMQDLESIDLLGGGRVDVTVGSALDLFGGDKLCYRDLVEWNCR
ncbi:phosphoribosyl formimino-5-aminoimidazole carboxamideribotide isomerase [Haloferula helveola]|uniref:Phosphoribosyl formimino-5-aminoimidazole carboxamideribotide isomerase n=1 Tax=Haloferula helveola TaxID=490095 RepID=A0ABM7RR94_9BACT|nr:phosphoribosyl formimino-5-aminoimidazole carboxamideribotide isomerase [Haloferula helveola]